MCSPARIIFLLTGTWKQELLQGEFGATGIAPPALASALPVNAARVLHLPSYWKSPKDMVDTSTDKQQIKPAKDTCDKSWSMRNPSNCLEITAKLYVLAPKSHSNSEKLQSFKERTGALPGDLRSHLHIINYTEGTIHQHLQTKAGLQSAKCMEIINPFSNQGLSCTCQARNSQKSWYTILNNLSLVKLYLTLILAALWIQSSLQKSRMNLFSLHSCGQKTASGIHLCSFTHVPTKGYTWTRSLLAAQQLILLNEVSG